MSKVRRKRVVVCRNVTTYSLLEIHVTSLYAIFCIFTARNSSCGKVMFSHACIIPSVHGEGGGDGMCGALLQLGINSPRLIVFSWS